MNSTVLDAASPAFGVGAGLTLTESRLAFTMS